MHTVLIKEEQETTRYVSRNALLSQIIAAEPDYLLPRLQIVDLPFNHTLYDEGDWIRSVYFPIDCLISSLAILEDGTTVEISMIGKEAIAGMSAIIATKPNQFWTRMCVGGYVGKIDAGVLARTFTNNTKVMKVLLQSYGSQVTQISQRSVCNVRHSVMERFCCWLLMVQERLGSDSLQLTQELIASRLGARRAGITVAARVLYDEGAIDYKRGLLHIKDREAIARRSCECYEVLKSEEDPLQQWTPAWKSEARSVTSPITQNTTLSFRKGRAFTATH